MDAISFILGVNSRDLRSSQLKDLIFRPPGNDASNKQLKASATLIYKDDENDEETRFSRTISNKGVGEYRINGKVVNFSKYEKVLASIGVLLKGRNFLVFQGDVESTARKSPKELVQWFEDISSSAELKEQYDEAYQKMQEAEATARDASEKQRAVWKKKRELKSQKEEAEKFKALVDNKVELLTEYFLWQLYHIRTDIEEKESLLEELATEIEENDTLVQEKAVAVREAKKEASIARNACAKLEKTRVQLVAEVDKAQPSIIKTEEEIKSLKKKIAAEKKKQGKLLKEAENREETLAKLEQEITEYTQTEKDLEQEYEDMKSKSSKGAVSLTEEQESEYERVREAAAISSAKPRQALNAANRKLETARAKAATLSEELKELNDRRDSATKKVKDLTERREKLEDNIQKFRDEVKNQKEDLQTVQRSAEEDQRKREAIDLDLEKINHTLRDAKDDKRQNEHEAKIEEAISTLKRYFPGVKGRLVRLCQPTMKRYDMAVTVAGGKDMDAVVVDTKQTAFECIQYLRTNQIGTATFLPLDSLQVPNSSSTERIRSMIQQDSRYRLAYDVIQCSDDSIKKAVLYAVGNTVVCEDLDSARNLCFGHRNRNNSNEDSRIKAVTLGGAVISKAGTMTGGISSEERSRAGRWNDRDVEKLRERKEELESQLDELDKAEKGANSNDRRISRGGRAGKVEELRNQLGNSTNRLQFAESDIKYTKEQLKEQQTLIKSVTVQITKVTKAFEDTEVLVDSLNDEVRNAIQQVKDAEEEHYGPFRESTGMTDFRAYDEALGKAREQFLKKRTTIREHLESLKAQKKYEEDRNFDDVLSKKEKAISNLEKKLGTAKVTEDELNESISGYKAKLADVEAELEDANRIEKRYEDEVRSAQADYKEAQSNGAKLSKTLNSEEAHIERLRVKLHETLQKARVEEAEIPFVDDVDDSESNVSSSHSSQSKRKKRSSRSESESQGSSDPQTQGTMASMHFSQADDSRVVKDRNETDRIDFSSLREDLKNRLSDKKEKELLKRFEDSIESISAQIEGMAPNMKAGDAFDNVVDQLEECNEDFSKAKELSKVASQHFEEIKRQRSDRFNTAFKYVSDSLTTIYKDMTKSSKHPLGGNAYLSIDDADEPYNGGIKFTAMPPMKRYRDMEYLSGGEKTIAALALLFAIHSYHPAPFFVMDEVDAALDNVNVLKLCNYIRQRSKDFQCIVISLKDMFFEKSESLVGICRDAPTNSSRTLTLDLTRFDNGEESITSTSISSNRKRSSSFSGVSNKRNRSLQ